MCGRYVASDDLAVKQQFHFVRTEWGFPASHDVALTQHVAVIRNLAGQEQGTLVQWGLIPLFAKDEPPKYSTINARIDTKTAASYRGPERKAPYYIHLNHQPVFAFGGGLWSNSTNADGTVMESCVHITMPANAFMRSIHKAGSNPRRMQTILHKEDIEAWLIGSAEDARAGLRRYDAGLMDAYEFSTRVNSPRNNESALLQAVNIPSASVPAANGLEPAATRWQQEPLL